MPQYDQNLPATRGSQGQGVSRYNQDGYFSPFSSAFFDASPFQMMRRMQEDMDRIFGPLLGGNFGMSPSLFAGGQRFQPSVDVSEDDKEYCIEVDLPGVKPEDVDVQVHDNRLILRSTFRQESDQAPQQQAAAGASGEQSAKQDMQSDRQYYQRERRYGYFERAFPLPQNVNQQSIRCDFKDGVLACHLPKTGEIEQPQGRRIPINAAGASTTGPQSMTAQQGSSAAGSPAQGAGDIPSGQTAGVAGEAEKEKVASQGAGAPGSNRS
jgi:HSP20 family protein